MAAEAVKGAAANNEVKKIQDNVVINARDPEQVSVTKELGLRNSHMTRIPSVRAFAYYVYRSARCLPRVCVRLYATEELRLPSSG